MKYYYTYLITNLQPVRQEKYYIGVRSCNCLPEDDLYISSSQYLKKAIHDEGLDHFETVEKFSLLLDKPLKVTKKNCFTRVSYLYILLYANKLPYLFSICSKATLSSISLSSGPHSKFTILSTIGGGGGAAGKIASNSSPLPSGQIR